MPSCAARAPRPQRATARSRSAPSGSTLPGGARRWTAEPAELARKEFDLLALLMRRAGTVVTRERLIDEVWDVNWFGSTKTLDVHAIGAFRKKLGPQLIHTVRGARCFVSPEELASFGLRLLAASARARPRPDRGRDSARAQPLKPGRQRGAPAGGGMQAQGVAAAAAARIGDWAQLQWVVTQWT